MSFLSLLSGKILKGIARNPANQPENPPGRHKTCEMRGEGSAAAGSML